MFEINDFFHFLIQGCFLKVAVIFLKNCSKDDNHKTTHEKILWEIFVLEVYL